MVTYPVNGVSLPVIFQALNRQSESYKWPERWWSGLPPGTGKRIVVPSVIQLAFSPVMLWP